MDPLALEKAIATLSSPNAWSSMVLARQVRWRLPCVLRASVAILRRNEQVSVISEWVFCNHAVRTYLIIPDGPRCDGKGPHARRVAQDSTDCPARAPASLYRVPASRPSHSAQLSVVQLRTKLCFVNACFTHVLDGQAAQRGRRALSGATLRDRPFFRNPSLLLSHVWSIHLLRRA